jgi:hypothetical protein
MGAKILCGMKAICEHCRAISLPSSESTIISMVRQYGFPAKKVGGVWISNTDAIMDWTKTPKAPPNPDDNALKDTPEKPVNPQKHPKNTPKTPQKHPRFP